MERFYAGALAADLVLSSGAIFGADLIVSGGTSALVAPIVVTSESQISGAMLMSGAVIEAQAATVEDGGFLGLPSGADLPGVTTVSAGGTLSGPGGATGDLYDNGVIDVVDVVSGSRSSKGHAYVEAGGVASGTSVSDGVESVLSGGVDSATSVGSGGEQLVEPGGQSIGVLVLGGGVETVGAGAVVDGLTLQAGATVDLRKVVATSAFINASGELVATSAGVTVDTIALGGPIPTLTLSVTNDGADGTDVKVLPVASDYNGDGLSDLTWRNTGGDAGVWMTTSAGGSTVVDFGGGWIPPG